MRNTSRARQSPNNIERREKGYSSAWLHHKGRNKHHLEYWIDYDVHGDHKMCGMKMPARYVAEMFCDRLAASKVYRGGKYRETDPIEYYEHSRDHYIIHPETAALLEKLLRMVAEKGEKATFAYIRREVLHNDR